MTPELNLAVLQRKSKNETENVTQNSLNLPAHENFYEYFIENFIARLRKKSLAYPITLYGRI